MAVISVPTFHLGGNADNFTFRIEYIFGPGVVRNARVGTSINDVVHDPLLHIYKTL